MTNGKRKLQVCQNLERELRAVLASEGLESIEISVIPPCCSSPCAPAGQQAAGEKAEGDTSSSCRACVIGCSVLKHRLSPPVGPFSWHGEGNNHCFEMLIGPDYAAHLTRTGAFLLTPGWLSGWERRIQAWGFDENTAREFFAESASRLVLLDTCVAPHSAESLRAFAAFVDRPAETLPVGLGYFRQHVLNRLLEGRLENERASAKAALAEAEHKLGDYAMVYDLMGRLTSVDTEERVVADVFELFTMLFAPTRLLFVPLQEGIPGKPRAIPVEAAEDQATVQRLAAMREDHAPTATGRGFILPIGEADERVGMLEVEGVAFPQYLSHYLSLSLSLAKVCSLAIRNARTYGRLKQNVIELQEAIGQVTTLRGLLPICAWCKKVRNDEGYWSQIESYIMAHSLATFSHGICPDCAGKVASEASRVARKASPTAITHAPASATAGGSDLQDEERPEAVLTEEMIRKLTVAAISKQYDDLHSLVEEIHPIAPGLATTLQAMADRFDYLGICRLLNR